MTGNIQRCFDEPAALQPDSCPCANLDHGHCSASCSEQRHGFGFGAITVSITHVCDMLAPMQSGCPAWRSIKPNKANVNSPRVGQSERRLSAT